MVRPEVTEIIARAVRYRDGRLLAAAK